jgi:peptidoglycan/LPS O-acetylase OafA/YrhL
MGVSLAFAALILAFHTKGGPLPFSALHKRLASFSYTLYLVHFPMLVFLVAGLHDLIGLRFDEQPSVSSLAYLATVTIFLIGYAWLVSLATEAKTRNVRELLMRVVRPNFVRFGKPQTGPAR